eukprot:CAMPEP_0194772616 /NCGR_PEP_ID=MMETSP0323_2-20130528/52520_1 /TAXON_ID=2866 ORGANISM="Crypthecodinium cohnii, Strain Seligo" /NCGR_SAMPLE_ID=MMETSP0323_2 /ASSEMBLY_ACC=CAM_ASM_000346 /LENGTH=37 /DNA_ID= /DNA_START= /DNA_END= /DNA_ORIENTATION=
MTPSQSKSKALDTLTFAESTAAASTNVAEKEDEEEGG